MRYEPLGGTFYFKFTTRDFDTGAPQTLGGTPVISAYEDNSLTQITAGISLTVDYDSVTGLNEGAVVFTAGNGFEAGKYYAFTITAGTVDGVSVVGEVVHEVVCGPVEADTVSWNSVSLDTTNPLPNAAPDAPNGLPVSDAGGLDLDALNTALATLKGDWDDGGRLDVIQDAIKAVTDLLPNAGALTDLASAVNLAIVDTVVYEIKVVTDALTASAAAKLAASAGTMVLGTATGTPTTTTMQDSALTEDTDDHYVGRKILWRVSGVLKDQGVSITGYNGTTKTFTFTLATDAATAGDPYIIV